MFNLKFTKMKKFYFLFSLIALVGLSVNVMGADSAINPYIGSTHTYQVVSHPSSTYLWKLTTNQDGSGSDLLGTVATGTNGSNSIALTWADPVIGTTYFLQVLETGTNSCFNRKAIAIIPVNNFQLDIANINVDNTSVLANPFSDCAPDVTNITWNGTAPLADLAEATNFTYDYGTVVFYYRIKASGINFSTTTWNADFNVAESSAGTVTVDYVAGADDASTPAWTSPTSGTVGDNSVVVPLNNEVLFVRITIANSTTNETLTAEDLTATLLSTSQENKTNLVATSLNTTSTVQTIKARPNSGSITTP